MPYLVSNEIGQSRVYKYKADAVYFVEGANRFGRYKFTIKKITYKQYKDMPRFKQRNPMPKSIKKGTKWFKALAARVLPNGAVQVRVPRGASRARAGNPSNSDYYIIRKSGTLKPVSRHRTKAAARKKFNSLVRSYAVKHGIPLNAVSGVQPYWIE